jgi:hypothetical protein
MRERARFRLIGSAAAATAVALIVSVSAGRVSAQSGASGGQGYVPPRTIDGQPDLQGFWKARTRAGYSIVQRSASQGMPASPGVVEGNELPYQPWAAARQKENHANRATADPLGKCYLPGVPRITYIDFPFQILQTSKYIAFLYEWQQVSRIIPLDGSAHWDDLQFWMGDSRGRWEGNTLVVDVIDHNDQTWFDMAGNFHSEALHVVERYTRADPDTIRYDVTIEDPKVFTRPWKMSMTLGRETGARRIYEYQCEAEAEELRGEFAPNPTWFGYPGSLQPMRPYADISRRPQMSQPEPRASATVPRMPDGKPNFQGFYNGSGQGASWGLEDHAPKFGFPGGKSIILDPPDQKLPYQAWARKEQQDRLLDERAHEDPTAHCFVAGVPRSNYVLGGMMQILQTPEYVVMVIERWSYRIIFLDGRAHLPDTVRLWMGDSVGHWQGDTLVVDSTNFNGKSWLTEIGDVISHGQHVVERFTMVDANKIEYEATVDDPIVYTRPWTIGVTYSRSRNQGGLMEQACLEGNQAFKLMKGAAEKALQSK